MLTIVGSAAALDGFASALRMVESNTIVDRETRQITVTSATPSRLVSPLSALAKQLLQPHDGTKFTAPIVEAVDPLDLLIITALPEQFGVIESLLRTMDRPDPSDYQFRVIPLAGVENVQTLLDRAQQAYDILTTGYTEDERPYPNVQADSLTGNLLVNGRTQSVHLYEQALAEARKLLPPARSGRMIALNQAKASEVIEPLLDLIEKTTPRDGAREIPNPTIEVVEQTNSLYVVAENAQHTMIQNLVRQLDTFEHTELPPLRLIQVRAADANQIALMLRQRYASRPAVQRREQPVEVTADAATNTLIITAHEDVYEDIKAFVDGVNRSGEQGSDRETMIYPLKLARATDLAAALDKLYPQPPMPRDRRGRPMPHLQKPKEVHVSADASTNTLIIEAPTERRASFEALVEQLDRVKLPPTAQLRTYHIERGDPIDIARTINELARRGVMSLQPEDGSKPVEVIVQAEPKSRTLIVAGDEVTFAKTEQILADLQAVPVPRSLRVFEVTGVDPQTIGDRAQRLYEEQTRGNPDARPVSVEVDRENGALLVVAEDEALLRFVSILNELQDSIGPPPDVRVIGLEYVDATEAAEFLRGLTSSELAMVGGRFGLPPLIEVIERTNSIIIAAQPQQHAIIQSLLKSMDKLDQKETPPLRILQLRVADARNRASALTRQYNQRSVEERNEKPVTITADVNTNSLIVAAHPDVLPEIQAIVTEINQADRMDYTGREIRIFPLQVARAEELAKTIDEMFPQPPVPRDRRGRLMYHLQEPREIVVRADPQTNSLIVDAPIQRMAGFENLVEQLDRQKILDATEVRTYQVVHADLNSLATTLKQLSASGSLNPRGLDRRTPITVNIESASQTLIISGPVEIFERVEQVLSELDVKRAGPATSLRFFKLQHARAESLAKMLQDVLLARIEQDVPDAGANVKSLLNVTADPKTNTLIISAPTAIMPVVEELIEQLDDSTAALSDPIVRVRPLIFADALEVSSSLRDALPSMISKTTGERMNVKLIPATGANALILVGLAQDVEEVEKLIKPLDERPSLDAIDAKTFKLTYADAQSIAPLVQNLLNDQMATDPRLILERIRRSRGRVSLTPTIRVESDPRTNSLIVSGPQRTVALAEAMIEKLDQPDEMSGRAYQTFTPSNADSGALTRSVQRIIDSTRISGRRSTLELIAEPRSGAIVVIGNDEEVSRAMELLAKWDADSLTAPQMDFRIVSLQHSDASVVARVVTPMLNDQARWPKTLRAIARAGITIGRPGVTADVAGNRLLLSAPAELMELANQLIAQLDQPRGEASAIDVRIFNLTQAQAEDVAAAVRSAMEARAAGEPGLPRVVVIAEPSSNSVLVTAATSQLARIESIIEALDQGTSADQIQVRTVFLKHARAENVAPIVEQLLAGEQIPIWLQYDAIRRRSPLPDTGPEVRVAADARLNAVVISAPPSVLNIAEQMVAQLDVDPAQLEGYSIRTVRVLVIENADARELASNLESIFSERDEADQPPTIRVDAASNSLLVRATEKQFATIAEIVQQIDLATLSTSREMRMIPIDPAKASAEDIANTLKRLLDRGSGSRVEIITVEDLLKRRRKVGEAPGKSDEGASPRGVSLNSGGSLVEKITLLVLGAIDPVQDQSDESDDDAADLEVDTLDEVFGDIIIAIDPATNSIIVTGSSRMVQRLADLARQLQDQIPALPATIRYITLTESIDARQLAQLVSQTLNQMTPPGGKRGDIRRRVSIVADVAGNALIVACNDTDFETIADLVTAMSQPQATEQVIVKIYPLHTITAERAERTVRNLIDPPARSGGRGGGRQVQRMRNLAIKLLAEGKSIDAIFDPNRIRISSDVQTNSLIVMGPMDAIGFIDQFIELIDQTPVNVQSTLKLYPLHYADAEELRRTLRNVFRVRYQSLRQRQGPEAIQPEFAADERTNTLLVTASPEQLAEIDSLLVGLDRKLDDDSHPLKIIELTAALPSEVARILKQTIIGSDQSRKASTLIVPDDSSGVLLVRAPDDVRSEIDAVLKQIDRKATSEFKVRTMVLEHASARNVAQALQQFFDDRAKIASQGRGRRSRSRQVSITGIEESRTLLIAASDEDFEEISRLVKQFDTAQASGALTFRVFQLKHAKASEIQTTVQGLLSDLLYNQQPFIFWWSGRNTQQRNRGTIAVRADERLNALIVTGEGDKFQVVENLIEMLDAPKPEGTQRIVKLYPIRNAQISVTQDLLREIFTDTGRPRRWWEPVDPNEVKIQIDNQTKTLIVSATAREHEEIATIIENLESQFAKGVQEIQVIPVEFAQALDMARTLRQFLQDRAQATNAPPSSATIIASDSANSLIVSAGAEDLATLRDLLSRLDQPDVTGERVMEIIVLTDGNADEIARILREQFSRRTGQSLVVTPDARTNSLIINAPKQQFAQALALVVQLDSPAASDETIIRTYELKGGRARDVVRILTETLQLDAKGETRGITIRSEGDEKAVEVKARIVADRRSNSIIVTATEESFSVIESLIEQIDQKPTVSPIEYRIIPLEHAVASDVWFTLRQFTRGMAENDQPEPKVDYNRLENHLIIAATVDQFEQITRIVAEIDQPMARQRITDFVPLKFAEAEKIQEALSVFYGPFAIEADTPGKINTRIVADPATNSLVISADESEWESIRALLMELDSEEYDSSLQLKVMPLTYADARSVARAINEAFQGSFERGQRNDSRRERRRAGGDGELNNRRDESQSPTVLVEVDEWVRASAEPQTNSVIVSASRQNMRKIEQIIEQLDVADYAKLPPPQIINVRNGDPEQLAASLSRLYNQSTDDRGRRALRIVGDPTSNSIIVRAEAEEFAQIKALAEALQDEASTKGLSVHVLKLRAAPAGRVATAITDAYAEKARQANQPLSIQVDRQSNALVIASTVAMYEEIKQTVEELDALVPAAGQSIFIIELQHVSPEAAKSIIETIGLDKPQSDDSVSKIVTEPIKVSSLAGRRAIMVIANPVDKDTIVGIIKAIDAEPQFGQAQTRVIKLRKARAGAVADILTQVLHPADQQVQTPLARAVQEQIRRLSVRAGDRTVALDLTQPIRIVPDENLNALVISSTEANVNALEQIIAMFDQLPITDAVTVQIYPLENIAADQFARIVRELFAQGKGLGREPGTDLEGLPDSAVGRALLDDIALSVDERTNTVIVAGKEESVALVEVLMQRLDSDVSTGWVEPRIIMLRHADATNLARTIQQMLVEGATNLPQSTPMQRQIARLRMARIRENGGAVIESDVFHPMTRLLILPEPQLNALIIVGTPANLEIISELVAMLDIEAASPSAAVRIYPIEHASAARLAVTITRLFDQQVQSKAIRPEDRVIVQGDERTNSLIVTTSPRSFVVLEELIKNLDAEVAPDLREIRRIALENTSATRLANLIQQLMNARLERLRQVQPKTADLERATILPDTHTNSLIIAAGNESFAVIERLARDLDRSSLSEASLLQVLWVEKGNVSRIAETINAIMDRRYADQPAELRNSQQPLVLTDPRTSSLLVAANPEDLASIEDLVTRLAAVPEHPAIGLHVIPLNPDYRADLLAPRLQRLMQQRQESLGEARTSLDRVTVDVDLPSNSLIVAATEENMDVVRSFVDVLVKAGAEPESGREFEIVSLRKSRAADIVDVLGELYVDEANRTRGSKMVRVTPDDRLNAVLINAPADDVRALRGLIAQLDGAKPLSVLEIKYIPLKSANALETVSLIEDVLGGRGIGPRRGQRQATVLKYLHRITRDPGLEDDEADETELVEMEVSAAVRESITLTPDLRTNTIIISAPQHAMRMIEQMIRDLDDSSIGAKKVRIFKLENADATAMAEILTDLFNIRRNNNLLVLKPREGSKAREPSIEDGGGPAVIGSLSHAELTAVPDERQQLSITVDSRTNSLLVSGSPSYLDLVASVVEELDQLKANERETFIYPLRNAMAVDVARVITEFVQTEQQKLISTLSADQIGSAARLLEREVTIVGDEKSNTVLVSASPRYMDRVRDIIQDLDVDPPQVLIQVLLAEVTLDDADDFGVDFEALGNLGNTSISGGFGLASSLVTGLGVPNLSIVSSDFDLLFKALQAQGRVQVLSNPTVIAANNETARIHVGETIRVPESTSFEQGTQQSSVTPEDVGVILQVTPSINPDGFVRMVISPEVSELSARTTKISEDFSSPIITRRVMTTTVTVRDGQTIVIGGLISDRFERRDQKVPLLGDLPLIGGLFRSHTETHRKTEFLIVLTPHIIYSPSEFDRIDDLTNNEIERMSIPDEIMEKIRRNIMRGTGHLYDAQGNIIDPKPEKKD